MNEQNPRYGILDGNILEKVCDAVQLSIYAGIEQSLTQARIMLRLPQEAISQANLTPELASCPRLVKHIRLLGLVYENLDDQFPEHGTFSRQTQETVQVRSYRPAWQARDQAVKVFNAYASGDRVQEIGCGDWSIDQRFYPERAVLIDQFGEPIDEYHRGRWLSTGDFSDVSNANATLRKIKEMQDEAALEARWNNFDTANRLRSASAELQRRLDIARTLQFVV